MNMRLKMKENNLRRPANPANDIKVHKVSVPASKVTGGGQGNIPETFGPSQPGTGMNWYG